MNESCHIRISQVTYEWVMAHVKWVTWHMNESCWIWMSNEWIMSHMNESCHIWMSQFTYEWVMAHMNESCHTCMSHVTCYGVMSYMNMTFTRDMTHPHLKRLVHVQPSDLAGSAAPLCLNTESYEEGISCIAIPVQCAAYAAPRHGSVWGPGGEFKVQSPAGVCVCLFVYI